MRRSRLGALALLVACAPGAAPPPDAALPSASPAPFETPSPEPLPGDAVRVVRVVDGDTIVVALGGRDVRVRLIGVDTPETKHPSVGVQCFGPEASRYLENLVEGKRVRLVYDVDRLDRYGRTLAYVYLGRAFVNLELVRRGYATILTIPPNVAHADEFLAAQRDARGAGRGLWRACVG